MIRRFVVFAGRKIKKLARAGRLKSKQMLARKQTVTKPQVTKKQERVVDTPAMAAVAVPQPQERGDGDLSKAKARPKKPKTGWTLDKFQVPPVTGKSRFHDFKLPLEVMHGVADHDFQYCTPIQAKALAELLTGNDLVAKAHTGTGKSAVFLITIFSRLLQEKTTPAKRRGPRALIIAPTRELAMQIAKDGRKLGRHTGLRITAVYGGANYQSQMDELRQKKVDILVATPGRLLDFVGKNAVSLDGCRIMVIDEADRMLDMGFIPDVRRIIGRLPAKEKRQTMLFSATVSDDVRRLSSQWCVKPSHVEAEPEQMAVDSVEQIVYLVTTEEKYAVLYNLIRTKKNERIMVFANMKSEVKRLSERLQRNGVDCVVLSGDVPQDKRESRLERFRNGKVKVLVATDVAGRGIHIDGIGYVINYTLPYEPEDYVHRIGRTGRAGAAGISVSFACEEGAFYLPEIEKYIGRKLDCAVPEEELLVKPPKGSAPRAPQQRPAQQKDKRRRSGRRRRGPAASSSKTNKTE